MKFVVYSLKGNVTLGTLRREDVDPIGITTGFQILIERLASLIHAVDIESLPAFITNVQPVNFLAISNQEKSLI